MSSNNDITFSMKLVGDILSGKSNESDFYTYLELIPSQTERCYARLHRAIWKLTSKIPSSQEIQDVINEVGSKFPEDFSPSFYRIIAATEHFHTVYGGEPLETW